MMLLQIGGSGSVQRQRERDAYDSQEEQQRLYSDGDFDGDL